MVNHRKWTLEYTWTDGWFEVSGVFLENNEPQNFNFRSKTMIFRKSGMLVITFHFQRDSYWKVTKKQWFWVVSEKWRNLLEIQQKSKFWGRFWDRILKMLYSDSENLGSCHPRFSLGSARDLLGRELGPQNLSIWPGTCLASDFEDRSRCARPPSSSRNIQTITDFPDFRTCWKPTTRNRGWFGKLRLESLTIHVFPFS